MERYDANELLRERFRMNGEPVCAFCDKTVDPTSPQVYKKVSGWEKNRGKGQGVFPIRGRRHLMEWAHTYCLDAALAVGTQESLV